MNGATVVCHDDMVTTAYYKLVVDLAPKMQPAAPQPGPGDIMRQTR